MLLEVISPENVLFIGEVDSVIVPGVQGQFEILKDHAAIVSILSKGEVVIKGDTKIDSAMESRFKSQGSGEVFLEINSGMLETEANRVTLIIE